MKLFRVLYYTFPSGIVNTFFITLATFCCTIAKKVIILDMGLKSDKEKNMDYTTFRENLSTLIRMRGMTGFGLSVELGITPATVTRHLAGTRNPELEYVVMYAKYFNVSIDWLLGFNSDQYETLPDYARELVTLYSMASDDDRTVIQAVLAKYKRSING